MQYLAIKNSLMKLIMVILIKTSTYIKVINQFQVILVLLIISLIWLIGVRTYREILHRLFIQSYVKNIIKYMADSCY